jgi:6-phosphogluconolactonase
MLPEIVVDDVGRLADRLAGLVAGDGRRAVETRGFFAVALPGGSVATTFFPGLAGLDFDWSSALFFWGDERGVPEDDAASNYGLARALWLGPAGVGPERIHRMRGEALDIDQAAADYADELVSLLGAPPCLDLVLLGVGPDGHVCSLFPGHPLLREEKRWVAAVHDAPKPPARRLTLTLPTLAAAKRVVFLAMGAAKAPVLREAIERPDSPLPLALLLRRAREAVVLLDRDAGRLLT